MFVTNEIWHFLDNEGFYIWLALVFGLLFVLKIRLLKKENESLRNQLQWSLKNEEMYKKALREREN